MPAAQVRELPATTSGLTTEIVRVTPPMAEKWLGKNVRNRNIRQHQVARYARAMSRGEWLLTGEAVKFAVTGELIDGQHRLLAIVESGETVSLMVVRGLPFDAQDVLDTGTARTAADQLSIHGHTNPALVGAAAKIVILYESGRFYVDRRNQNVSHREILDFAAGNTMMAFAAARARTVTSGSDLRPAVAAASLYLLMKVDDQDALTFFDRLADGVNLPARSPILALRARLRAIKDDRTMLPNQALVSLVFRTWNAWLCRRPLTNLPLYRGGELIPCPEPKTRRA